MVPDVGVSTGMYDPVWQPEENRAVAKYRSRGKHLLRMLIQH
jgi:hypothetical protein